MVKKSKVQKITLKSIIRLTIFIFFVYLAISLLSQKQQPVVSSIDPTSYIGETSGGQILGTVYSKLPSDSRYQIEHFDKTFLGKFYKNSAEYLTKQLNGFPQKQIKQLKKDLIKNISDDLIKNIDNE